MSVYKKILDIRKSVGVVNKNGENKFHHYNYATINDVIHEVRDKCNEHGILFIPLGIENPVYTKADQVISGLFKFKVVDADSGDSFESGVMAGGEDKGDKHTYKTDTGALKYLLIQLFLLPTEDDPENDKNDKQPPKASDKISDEQTAKSELAKCGNDKSKVFALFNKCTIDIQQKIIKPKIDELSR